MNDKNEVIRMAEQQRQIKRVSQKQIERYEEIHRVVQAVADHWRTLPRQK